MREAYRDTAFGIDRGEDIHSYRCSRLQNLSLEANLRYAAIQNDLGALSIAQAVQHCKLQGQTLGLP
jgi:hypothetical protein